MLALLAALIFGITMATGIVCPFTNALGLCVLSLHFVLPFTRREVVAWIKR